MTERWEEIHAELATESGGLVFPLAFNNACRRIADLEERAAFIDSGPSPIDLDRNGGHYASAVQELTERRAYEKTEIAQILAEHKQQIAEMQAKLDAGMEELGAEDPCIKELESALRDLLEMAERRWLLVTQLEALARRITALEAELEARKQDWLDGVYACLVAAGAPEDIDEMETIVRAAGKYPSDFVRRAISEREVRIASLEAELARHHWIPVGERLPEEHEIVLVWWPVSSVDGGPIYSASYEMDDDEPVWCSSDGFTIGGKVTHWRPLPEGPKL